MKKNGLINEQTYDIQEFMILKQNKKPKQITKLCDIYSIGAIIFKLLLGRAPTLQISQFIADNNLHETTPDSNVYEIPYFFKDFILSNDMCQICVKLLH